MMNRTSPERVRQDSRLIGQTLLKMALPRLLIRAAVLVIAAVVWLLAASWLLDFGRGLSFDSLHALGQQATGFMARINPYVWWGVVVIWTLIIFFIARAWLAADIAAARARPIAYDDLASLTGQLSEDTVAVLKWVWGSREEPFTVGDLRQAHTELRHSRIAKLELVRQQGDILDRKTPATPPASPGPRHASSAAPSRTTVAADTRPAGDRIEPNL